MHYLRDWSNRFSNNKACRGRFSIVDGHGFESILRGAMEVECKPSSKHLVVKIKNKDDLLTLACTGTWRRFLGRPVAFSFPALLAYWAYYSCSCLYTPVGSIPERRSHFSAAAFIAYFRLPRLFRQ